MAESDDGGMDDAIAEAESGVYSNTSPSGVLCRHCGGALRRMYVYMNGPGGPWIHDFPRQRLCPNSEPNTFAEPA